MLFWIYSMYVPGMLEKQTQLVPSQQTEFGFQIKPAAPFVLYAAGSELHSNHTQHLRIFASRIRQVSTRPIIESWPEVWVASERSPTNICAINSPLVPDPHAQCKPAAPRSLRPNGSMIFPPKYREDLRGKNVVRKYTWIEFMLQWNIRTNRSERRVYVC